MHQIYSCTLDKHGSKYDAYLRVHLSLKLAERNIEPRLHLLLPRAQVLNNVSTAISQPFAKSCSNAGSHTRGFDWGACGHHQAHCPVCGQKRPRLSCRYNLSIFLEAACPNFSTQMHKTRFRDCGVQEQDHREASNF